MSLIYDETAHAYRDAATGRLLTARQMRRLRDLFAAESAAAFERLAARHLMGGLTPAEWRAAFGAEVVRANIESYVFGRGGIERMTDLDWEKLAAQVVGQVRKADAFVSAVGDGALTEAQTMARASLYGGGPVNAFESGQMGTYTGLLLPAQPGDWSSECKSGCNCGWLIEETETDYLCTWDLSSGSDHCPTCLDRAATWSPLVIAKSETVERGDG